MQGGAMSITARSAARRTGVTGIHSINRFAFSVPVLEEAERFYTAFGLDVRRNGSTIELRTFGNPHCWGLVHADGQPKKLQYLSFGIFPEDEGAFAERIGRAGIRGAP